MPNPPATSKPLNELQRRRLQDALGPHCEVRGLLGSGGFADVYDVWDRRLKRELAVKTLRSDIVISEALLQRFQREAEAMAQLRHPSIVPIYSVGEAVGIAYFTMPRIHGESLAAVLAHGGIVPVPEAVRILTDCASALTTAHRVGLVHRDVKPENIMLEGSDRRAVVMDFGISKSLNDDVKLTGTGTAMGTPDYMSPEQAMGERTIDARSDQYSLAVVGFRMLTGRMPFHGDSVQTLIFKQVTEVAPTVQSLNPEVPTQIADAIARALSKDPAARFPSMEAFAQALAYGRDTGGQTGAVRRQELDFQARVAVMRKLLEQRWRPLAAGLVAFVVFVVLLDRAYTPAARAMAESRADAMFAAKAFVASRGGTPGRRSVDAGRDTGFAFLRAAAGRDSAERLALLNPPERFWEVTQFSKTPRAGRWVTKVGVAGKIVGYDHLLPDTARGETLSRAAALALAEQELRSRGWDPATLRLQRDSVIDRRARRDWLFRWLRPAPVVARDGETARILVSVGVHGSEVAKYDAVWRTPGGYGKPALKPIVTRVGTGVLYVALVFLGIGALVWVFRRQRVDVLRMTTATRLALFATLSFIATMIFPEITIMSDDGTVAAPLIGAAVLLALAGGVFVLLTALVESLSAERRPTLTAGIHDVASGRLIVPEMPVAALYGSVGAVIVLAIAEILHAISMAQSPTLFRGLEEGMESSLPTAAAPGALALGLCIAMTIGYLLLLLQRWNVPRWLALTVPAAFLVGLQMGFDEATMWHLTTVAVGAGVVTWLVWRYGWLSAVVAVLVLMMLPGIVATLRFGDDDVRLATFLSLAILAVPLAAGLSAYRRFAPFTPAETARAGKTSG